MSFTRVPNRLIDDPRLSDLAFRAAVGVLRYQNPGDSNAGVAKLAVNAGVEPRTMKRGLAEIVDTIMSSTRRYNTTTLRHITVESKRFTRIDNVIIDGNLFALSHTEFRAICLFARWSDPEQRGGATWGGWREIAAATGWSKRKVRRVLKRLSERNILVVVTQRRTPTGAQDTALRRLNPVDQWRTGDAAGTSAVRRTAGDAKEPQAGGRHGDEPGAKDVPNVGVKDDTTGCQDVPLPGCQRWPTTKQIVTRPTAAPDNYCSATATPSPGSAEPGAGTNRETNNDTGESSTTTLVASPAVASVVVHVAAAEAAATESLSPAARQPAKDPRGNNPFDLSDFELRAVEAAKVFQRLKIANGCAYCNPLPRKTDPRQHHDWQHFVAAVTVCEKCGIPVREYLRCVLWRSAADLEAGFEVFPDMLLSEWARKRYVQLRHQLPPEDDEHSLLEKAVSVVRLGRDRVLALCRRNLGVEDIAAFWRSDLARSQLTLRRETLPDEYLAVSRTFWAWVEEINDPEVNKYVADHRLTERGAKLLSFPGFVENAEVILGDDLAEAPGVVDVTPQPTVAETTIKETSPLGPLAHSRKPILSPHFDREPVRDDYDNKDRKKGDRDFEKALAFYRAAQEHDAALKDER